MDKETDKAIGEVKKLGGVGILPPPQNAKQCCCWGTPIGDKLLALAEDLDRDGMAILAQVAAEAERHHYHHGDSEELDFSQVGARSGSKKAQFSDNHFAELAA